MYLGVPTFGLSRAPRRMGAAKKDGTIDLRVSVRECLWWESGSGADLQQQWTTKKPFCYRVIYHALLIEEEGEQWFTAPISQWEGPIAKFKTSPEHQG